MIGIVDGADLEKVVLSAPIGICILDAATLTSEIVNEKFLEVAGKPYEAIYGQFYWDSFPETRLYYEPILQAVVDNAEPYYANEVGLMLVRHGKEEWVYVTFVFTPIKKEDGTVYKVAIWILENTLQVKARQEIQESEERFRNMAESNGVYIAMGDATTNATYFNQPWSVTTGRSMEDLLKFGWLDLVHPDDRDRHLNLYLDAFKEKKPFTGEFGLKKEAGDYIWLLVNGYPRFLTDGSFAGYTSSSVDITERKKDEQRRNDFIGMVSHELKTPLTSMSGYLQILQARARKSGDTQTGSILDKANKQTKRMGKLISGFLDTARLESGKLQINNERFDMADLMKEAEDEATTIVANHIIIFAPVEEAFLLADRDKIGQVVTNFISNANKYSPMGTTIHVACINEGGKVLVTVKDEGMGIAPQDKEKIFERFYRAQGAGMDSIAGFGIGLYLCAEIIQRHGGEIGVESEPGKGSTFYFTLPIVA